MTPAEELRAAATKLRDTAGPATPGPWKDASTIEDGVTPRWILGAPSNPGDAWSADDAVLIAEPDQLISDGDLAWIALAGPQLAEPLAYWLISCANDLADARHYVDEPISVNYALIVARAILGTGR